MRLVLPCLLCMLALAGYGQDVALVTAPEKAVAQLEKLRKQTEKALVIGRRTSDLPPEARPMVNKILLQSTADFLAMVGHQALKDAYLQSLDAGLARLTPLVPKLEDRQQVASYYQDLLDIVGLESSEGRLTAFVERGQAKAKP
jgi:hypothetical protein